MLRLPNRRKFTVTIGVPAYQSEGNIAPLLESLCQQHNSRIRIEKILVYSDGSTDNTVRCAQSVQDRRVNIFPSKHNRGYAYALEYLIKKSSSDIFVTFNDDVMIKDGTMVEKLVAPMIEDPTVTFVSGNIEALPPKTFIGRSIYTSYLAFIPIRQGIRGGQNMYSCDGKVLALRRDFARTVSLEHESTATVDIFLYFENLRFGGVYRFVQDATVQFRLPETAQDWRNLQRRSVLTRQLMQKTYGSLYEREAHIPRFLYCRSLARVALKYPLESAVFKFLINSGTSPTHVTPFKRWTLTTSTKRL